MAIFEKLKSMVTKKSAKKGKSKKDLEDAKMAEIESMKKFIEHREAMKEADFDRYCIEKFGQVDALKVYTNGFEGPLHYMNKDGYVNVNHKHTRYEELYRDSGEYEVTYPERGRFVYMNDEQNGYQVVRLTHEDIVEIQNLLGLTHETDDATKGSEIEGM